MRTKLISEAHSSDNDHNKLLAACCIQMHTHATHKKHRCTDNTAITQSVLFCDDAYCSSSIFRARENKKLVTARSERVHPI